MSSPSLAPTRRLELAMAQLGKARFLVSTSSILSLARIAGALAGFVTQVVLARTLQASSLGLFYSVLSLMAVVGLLAAYGYPAIAPRFISRYREQGKPGLIVAFVARARRDAALYVAIASVGVAVSAIFWPGLDSVTRSALLAAAFAIPANAALRVNGSVAGALKRFALAYLPDTSIRPFLLLAGVLALMALGIPFDAADITWMLAVIFTGIALVEYVLVQRHMPKAAAAPVQPRLSRLWRREATPLIVVVLFTEFFADVDILFLTPLVSHAEIGIFGLCLKLAVLVGFAVQVAQYIAVPELADAHARKSFDPIGDILTKALLFPLAATLGAIVFVALWGEWMLSLFGPEFTGAKLTLLILIGSQLLRVVFGPNVGLLTVLGAQKQNAALATASIAVLALGNLLLAPWLGAPGAALAVLIAMGFWMLTCSIILHRMSGLRTDALYLLETALARRAGKTG